MAWSPTADCTTPRFFPSHPQLDLWAVADASNYLFKLPTLMDMLAELLAPYGELRIGAASPSDEDAFYLRHGESKETLKVRARRTCLRPRC